jgi:hypothetical protein
MLNIVLLIRNRLKNRENIQFEEMKNRKTPMEFYKTLPMGSFVKEKNGSCRKARQCEEKVFSSTAFSSGG